MQACKLNLPHTRPSLEVTSLLLEPSSNTLALMHIDSSILLLPSLTPFSPPLIPQSQTLIPPTSTSSCFIRLQTAPNSPNPRVVFAVAGPYHNDSRLLLRFWILKKNRFVRAKVVSNQKGFVSDDKLGIFAGVSDGVDVKLVGEVNFFAMRLVKKNKILVFAVRVVDKDEDCVKLIKCAVIDCSIEICSVSLSSGFLFLGESRGVRVFPLRLFVKGRLKEERNSMGRNRKQKEKCDGCSDIDKSCSSTGHLQCSSNALAAKVPADKSGKAEMNADPSKLRTVKLKQDSRVGGGAFFVQFSLEEPCQKSRAPTFWVSDGFSSVHVMSVSDMEIPSNENDKSETAEKQMQISAIEAVFASEKIQDLIPLSANSILLLGQGNIFAYAIS